MFRRFTSKQNLLRQAVRGKGRCHIETVADGGNVNVARPVVVAIEPFDVPAERAPFILERLQPDAAEHVRQRPHGGGLARAALQRQDRDGLGHAPRTLEHAAAVLACRRLGELGQ